MSTKPLNSKALTEKLKDRQVSQVTMDGPQRLSIEFSDGTILTVDSPTGEIRTSVAAASTSREESPDRPTKRQSDYLAFISTYINHFGRAPAEADIERHFMVSAPSVNQMMQTLERRGFITRQPGVARSIRLGVEIPPAGSVRAAR